MPSDDFRKRTPSGQAVRKVGSMDSFIPQFSWLHVSFTSATPPCGTMTHCSSPNCGDEKAGFEQDYKRYIHFPRAMFIIGVLIIILVSLLKPYLDPLTHAIILIIGTAVAGKGVVNWYEQVPAIRARKQLTEEIDKTSTIVFEYGDSQGSSDTHAEHDDHRANA